MKHCVYCDIPMSMWGFDRPCPNTANGHHRTCVAAEEPPAGPTLVWSGILAMPRLSVVEGEGHATPRRRGLHVVK